MSLDGGEQTNRQTQNALSIHRKDLGMGTMTVILPSILSFICSRKGAALDGKGPRGNPGGPSPGNGATHPLTPRLRPRVTCPEDVVGRPRVPGPCPEVPPYSQGHKLFRGAQALAKGRMTFFQVTEASQVLIRQAVQIKASRRKGSP